MPEAGGRRQSDRLHSWLEGRCCGFDLDRVSSVHFHRLTVILTIMLTWSMTVVIIAEARPNRQGRITSA